MTILSKDLGDIFSDCKNWIARNPTKVRTLESRIYIIAQVLLGKFNNTKLKTEWLRSAYKLVSLFNGLIILHSNTKKPYTTAERINICVAVLEHCEIAIEKSAEQVWGADGRWSVIKYLQIIKFLAKMTLILHFKEKMVCHPLSELGRILQAQTKANGEENVDFQPNSNNVLRLKGGRVMRTVASAPPLYNRLWKPPTVMDIPVSPALKVSDEERMLQMMGEMIYVLKPIVNLALIQKYGSRNWKQWSCSLFMDMLSVYLMGFTSRRGNVESALTPVEMSVLTQRRANLFFYFIRSPFFQRKVANPLYLILYMIPYIGPTLSDELRFYLSSYYFLWSN